MAAPTKSNSQGISWSKWQLGFAVGASVVAGLGYWYLTSRKSTTLLKNEAEERQELVSDVQSEPSELKTGESAVHIQDEKCGEQAEKAEEALTPLEQALAAKNKGNKLFKGGKYAEAIKCYTDAVEICPPDKKLDLATFYQNRAAAYEHLNKYNNVKQDCTKALKLNPKYIKALHRRAKASEVTKDLSLCLEDVTAICILEGFQNQSTLILADRVLKELGKLHAKEAASVRKPVMPSKHFIQTYFSSFTEEPIMRSLAKEKESDVDESEATQAAKSSNALSGYMKAKQALRNQDYDEIVPACTEELESDIGTHKPESLLLRATFYQLLGRHQKALKDFGKLIDDIDTDVKLRVNALIKRASLYMQLEDPMKSLQDFNKAAELDPSNSDVFHHRGQINLLLENINDAISDFEKSVSINPNFPVAYVQKCYTDYRHALSMKDMDKVNKVMNNFQDAIEKFPKCPECCTLYAQVLSDQQEFEKADDYFQKAIQIDPENATVYVHRGLLQLQWKGNIDDAMKLISKAVEMDDKCEFGYETLGTIEVQRGNLRRAIELFDKAIPLSKTEVEMSHLFSLRDAAIAQDKVARNMGIPVPTVGTM